VTEKWIPEITLHVPNARFIFVGNKTDMWENEFELKKLQEDGFKLDEMKSKINGLKKKYPHTPKIETSCLTKVNVEEAAILAVKEAIREEIQEKKKECIIS
jgi:hypothetical protein